MNLIAAVDNNWGIGYNNKLLYRIKEDLINFKKLTLHSNIIMGYKTYQSIGKVLPKRTSIVLTKKNEIKNDNIIVCRSINQLLSLNLTGNIFVIGGQSIYAQLLQYCTSAYITKIYVNQTKVDTFMVNLDKQKQWTIQWQSEIKFCIINGEKIFYQFYKYIKE